MERLTERELNVMGLASYTKCNTDECVGYCGGCNAEEEAKLKLKHYEDLDEQGLIIRLPLKIGDDLWDNDFGRPCSYYVTGFSFGRLSPDEFDDYDSYEQLMIHYTGFGSEGRFPLSEFGKTVFLTKEEAEKALEEMEKKYE